MTFFAGRPTILVNGHVFPTGRPVAHYHIIDKLCSGGMGLCTNEDIRLHRFADQVAHFESMVGQTLGGHH